MLPETGWNHPFTPLEDNRKDLLLQKMSELSQLWMHQISVEPVSSWNELYRLQIASLEESLTQSSSQSSFFNQLQNLCWQFGRSLAEKDWPEVIIEQPLDAFRALSTLKIGESMYSDCYLLERSSKKSCSFYWLSSPIESPQLCLLYLEIFRGYFYHLSRNLRTEIHTSILPSAHEKVKAWKISLLWID